MKQQQPHKNRLIPASIKHIGQWQLSRRHFVKSMLAAAAISQLPLLSSCVNDTEDMENLNNKPLSKAQKDILKEVQLILFPDDGHGPSANDVHALAYVEWVILDKRMDPDEVAYIINGIGWVEETAQEEYALSFIQLSSDKRNALIEYISKENWGESWLSVILTFIFEALLSDPQYGGNPNSIGWKWLEHFPGYPRPTPTLLYDTIFKTISS